MAITSYSTKGPVFKLALENGTEPEHYALFRHRYDRHRSPVPLATALGQKIALKKITMKQVRKMVDSGVYTWCGYSDHWRPGATRSDPDEIAKVGWLVGTNDTGDDWVRISAPSPDAIATIRQDQMAGAALAGGGKKTIPKALVKSLVDAIRAGDMATVEKLAPLAARGTCEEKASAYSTDFSTTRPLFVAAVFDDIAMLERVLPHADIEAADNTGQTALFKAIRAEKAANVQCLVEAGANTRHVDSTGQTPLMCATGEKSRLMCELLLPHSDANALDDAGENALMAAIRRGAEETVKTLLPVTTLTTRNKAGLTALMLAIDPDNMTRQRNLGCAKLVIEATLNVDAVDNDGDTCLMRLIARKGCSAHSSSRSSQSRELAAMLLGANADPRGVYADGDSLLTHAIRNDLGVYVELLLPWSDAKHAGKNGDTALVLAARNANLGLVRRLSSISDPLAENSDGETALLATFGKDPSDLGKSVGRILSMLHLLPLSNVDAAGKQGRTALMLLALADQPELLSMTLAKANPKLQDADGMNALMHAIGVKNNFIFDQLVHVSDLSTTDHQGQTALIHASRNREPKYISALIRGSKVDHQDATGRTALMHAVSSQWNCNEEVVDLLLRFADARLVDREGKTAAHIATRNELTQVASLISAVEYSQREDKEIKKVSKGGRVGGTARTL